MLLGFIICLTVGLLALGALWWLYRAPSATSAATTLPAFQPARIVPSLALMQLAGDPVEALAYQAINAGETETSRALTWIGLTQMAPARIALLLKLATAATAEEQPATAQALYQQVRALAVLDSALTPLARSQALLRCVSGLLALDEPAAALDVAQQVLLIVKQAPDLLPAQRNQILRDLQSVTLPLRTAGAFQRELTELIRNPYLALNTTLFSGQWPTFSETPAPDPLLVSVTTERQRAARAFAQRLLQVQPLDAEAERQRLVLALSIEDQERTAYFYQISATQNLTFSLQFLALAQQRDWLITKLAVAQRLYGVTLIPEWETNQTAIVEALAQVTDNLQQQLLSLAQTQSTREQQVAQRFYALTWLAQQIEFGLYPQSNAAEVGEQLRVLQGEMAQLNLTPALPVAYVADAIPPGFRIIATTVR
ncbi:MAG: hypothetical protein DYG89_44315 [Caldilinea sp. CFX5]|nr:hypothetical protein [Caldilinea sp. CFX5]